VLRYDNIIDKEETSKKKEIELKHKIEAAIVNLTKIQSYNRIALLETVNNRINKKISVPLYKKCLLSLVEREYISITGEIIEYKP